MHLVSYNIQYGIGLDEKYDLERIAASLRGADVIALQEVTRNFGANGYADMVAGLEALFPQHFTAYHAPVDVLLNVERREDRVLQHRLQFGNMILSRHPILSTRGLMLPRSRTYDKLNLQRSALEAVIETPLGPLRVYCLHLDHISPEERLSQIEALRRVLADTPAEGVSLTGGHEIGMGDTPAPEDYVVLGDFNLQPETPEYHALFGRPDPYYGRVARRTHPVDAMTRLGRRTAGSYSWQGPGADAERLLLDYALVSPSLVPRLVDVRIDETAAGSDHLPLWLELA